MKSPEQAAFKVILIVAVLIAIAVLPLAARADSHRPAPPAFSDFDADGDGRISEQEFNTLRAQRIAANAAEGRQMRGLASAPAFSEIDSDSDGQLDEAEFTAAQKAHMQEMRGSHGKGKGRHEGAHHRHQGKGMKMPSFEDLDLDENGCIDPSEFAEHQANYHYGQRGTAPETE